jgi:hypothetical protein
MDINAAVLRDVDELTYREIAEQLDLPISDGAKAVGDYSKVSRMVDRGRDIRERAWRNRPRPPQREEAYPRSRSEREKKEAG